MQRRRRVLPLFQAVARSGATAPVPHSAREWADIVAPDLRGARRPTMVGRMTEDSTPTMPRAKTLARTERRKPGPKAERAAAPPPRDPGLTHAERLRSELADDIVCGRLSPGTALDETSLAARFGVSRTPVREALRELAAAGLVVHRAHRGAVVTALTEDRLKEMFVVMAELEALAAGACAVAMSPSERQRLVDIHDHAESLVRRGDLLGYTDANDQFHGFLYEASHNSFLAETALSVRRRVSAFRRAQFRTLGRLTLSHEEHDRVVQAILRGDREAATREMRSHLESVRHSFIVFHDGL